MKNRYLLEELTFEITKKCPMKCLLCSSNGGLAYTRELDLYEIKNIIDASIELGTRHVNLSGGEPLIHPNIIDICSYIKNKGPTVDVYTCGNIRNLYDKITPIDEELLLSLKKFCINKLIFSIHGDNAELHNMITKRKGSFENLIESIKRAVKIGLYTELHFVATKLNYRSLSNIMHLVTTLKINRLSVLRFVLQGRGEKNKNLLELNSENLIELREILNRINGNYPSKFRIGSPFNCFFIQNLTSCTAGVNKATIKADASVFPCVSMKDFVTDKENSNLLKRSLDDIWQNSVLFNSTRRSLRIIKEQSECKYCDHFQECRGGCLTQRIISNGLEQRDPYCLEILPPNRIEKQII